MPNIVRYSPCPELAKVLLPAFEPCRHFNDACKGTAVWSPSVGHIPRGFVGALGDLSKIELVLIVAEPGNPLRGEKYADHASAEDRLERGCASAFRFFQLAAEQYPRNVRRILDACWPRMELADQLRKSWITESFLCSAPTEGGHVPAVASRCCVRDYLRPQIELLRGRAIVACGAKARDRVAGSGFEVLDVGALAPPGCNTPEARRSRDQIPAYLHSHRVGGAQV